jgi:hypothetical protein
VEELGAARAEVVVPAEEPGAVRVLAVAVVLVEGLGQVQAVVRPAAVQALEQVVVGPAAALAARAPALLEVGLVQV